MGRWRAGANGVREALLTLLGSINICDKSPVFQHYDSEVQGRAVLRPGEADACVEMFVPGAPVALATSIGSHSRLGAVDPYLGGAWSVFEAITSWQWDAGVRPSRDAPVWPMDRFRDRFVSAFSD